MRTRGADVHYTLDLDFVEAATGASKEIGLPSGDRLKVKIPEGTADGQTIRLRGKGGEGYGGGPRGDALVTVTVRPHRHFRREGNDIVLTLPITLDEAVLGAKVRVPTITGPVSLTIPKGASGGQTLRLKGRGVKGGDQRVELRIALPDRVDPELERFMQEWRERHRYDPRRGMTG
jgi:DnaJ-class molecular chaperone